MTFLLHNALNICTLLLFNLPLSSKPRVVLYIGETVLHNNLQSMVPLQHDQVRGKASVTKLDQLNEIRFKLSMQPGLRVCADVTENAQRFRMPPDKVYHLLSLFEGLREYGAAPFKIPFNTLNSDVILVATYIL